MNEFQMKPLVSFVQAKLSKTVLPLSFVEEVDNLKDERGKAFLDSLLGLTYSSPVNDIPDEMIRLALKAANGAAKDDKDGALSIHQSRGLSHEPSDQQDD